MQRVRNLAPTSQPADARYVLYWMTGTRRARRSFSLDRAADIAVERGLPLLVYEPLRVGYRWAADRHHRFLIEGMAENQRRFESAGITYLPYVEPAADAGKGMLRALARHAAHVVTDEVPGFFHPRMQAAAAQQLEAIGVGLDAVDSWGLMPLALPGRAYPSAAHFRRVFHREVPALLSAGPRASPLKRDVLRGAEVPDDVLARWPTAELELLLAPAGLAELPIDHDVAPSDIPGGSAAAERALREFVDGGLESYADLRSHPDHPEASSGLSPWLHHGHLSVHDVVAAVFQRERFAPDQIDMGSRGKREGYWGLSAPAESFLDEVLIWREVCAGFCFHTPRFDELATLPPWALESLLLHEADERPAVYSRAQLERAETDDELWNAAQRQLLVEGRIHNALRMLWGKKILEWSPTVSDALSTLVELNNRWSLDGRDPNSYGGIFWTLGRFDRPWPERAVFGRVRSMSSLRSRKKWKLEAYLERWGPGALAA